MTADPAPTPPRWATTSWGLDPTARTGSEQGLSAQRIVQAGVELADESGLEGLSIRKLGQHLGAGTMAAYRHIESKDDLVVLMGDAALGVPPASILEADRWQDRLIRWAGAISARYQAHPWLIDAPIAGLPATPNRSLWLEYVLQALEPSGLDLRQMLDAALLVDGHARNVAYLVRELQRSAKAPEQGSAAEWLAPLLDRDVYPMLSRVLTTGFLEDDTVQDVDFGMARIVAGLESLVADGP